MDLLALPDKESLKETICRFLDEWCSQDADEMSVEEVCDGYNSSIFIVGSSSAASTGKVVVRLFKPRPFDPLKMSETEQALTYSTFASHGWGTRLHGVFAGGRVEEFVEGSRLMPDHLADPLIRAEVAKSYARFHSLTLPCDKSRTSVFNQSMIRLFAEMRGNEKLLGMGRSVGVDMSAVTSYDFASGMQKVLQRLEEMSAKKCWCVVDPQKANVLVRDRPAPHQSKVVLIDFEFVTHHYRGFDVGGHFFEVSVNWMDLSMGSDGSYTRDQEREFCTEYLRESARLSGQPPTAAAADASSVDQLVREADLGLLLRLLFHLFCGMRHVIEFGDEEGSMLKSAVFMLQLFRQRAGDLGLE